MTARQALAQSPKPDAVAVFVARAEARATLYAAAALDLQESVDVLQADAEHSGLLAAIGQDRVQTIIAAAFAAVGDDLIFIEVDPSDTVPDPVPEQSRSGAATTSTLQAAEFLFFQQKDPARLRAWLAQHSAEERAAILQHLEQRKKARAQ
jgi:hypothetical protein